MAPASTPPLQTLLPGLEDGAASSWCQRWSAGQCSWRHLAEGGFDQSRYLVRRIRDGVAAAFIRQHHYSGQPVAALQSYGLIDRRGDRLVGVAVLSVPVNRAVLTATFPTLEPYRQSVDLGRLVLEDNVAANGESFMLARVFRQAHQTGIRGVVSFADPVPRRTLAGDVVLRGHVGACYQALGNCLYTGRGTARTLLLLPDGTALNDRALQKVRTQEPGHRYVENRLLAAGAHPRVSGQDPRQWLTQALVDAGVQRVRHAGPHRYAFPLGTARERARTPIGHPVLDNRPKVPDRPPLWPPAASSGPQPNLRP